MQRDEPKKTKITVWSDRAIGISSQLSGANVGVLAFNQEYIMLRNPELGLKLLKLFRKARATRGKPPLDNNDPRFGKVTDKMVKEIMNSKGYKDYIKETESEGDDG